MTDATTSRATPRGPAVRRRDPRRLAAAAPERIADGVHLLRGGPTRTMNVVLIEDPAGGVVAFDAGEKSMATAILAASADLGGLRRVVLGHGDTDHRGAAPALRKAGAGSITVACHPDARPHAEGRGGRDYWKPHLLPLPVRVFHGAMHHVWDGGPVKIDETLVEGDQVAGFTVINLPGHAPGLIGLYRAADRLALVSDAFYMTSMWGHPQPPALPLEAYNHDTAQARESLRRLAALDPLIVVPGHLGPLTGGGVRATLERASGA